MRKFAICSLLFAICAVSAAVAAPREPNAQNRTNTTTVARSATTTPRTTTAARGATTAPREISVRDSATARQAVVRTTPTATLGRSTTGVRAATPAKTISARAAIDETAAAVTETRTGAAYEQCKEAYFTCMDQFCKLKNDDYRRCSCSDRVYDLGDKKSVLTEANTQLTAFTESLDSVGMTTAQATAMKTASDGENALTGDSSASKALLQAIMNSIKGEDTNVGGKFSSLNSINLSFDTANAFGMTDTGQIIASYNGKNLYTAVYPQCRNAVRADCTDAALQRAVTAYLMAVEQDCNTVQTVIQDTQKKMTAAVREGSAMLDLARVENRQNHNSDDMTACLGNVEKAILSEEVCGAGYHKCLDNGEFIGVSTGAPIAGVVNFYELEKLLTFNTALGISDQKLAKISNNRMFVTNFEKRVKKFAEPALDKCTEIAGSVWEDYLDKAMLDIHYAQQAKVSEIKQGCFDFVSSCYVNGDNALTAAMTELMGNSAIEVQPNKITLNGAICSKYVDSCNNMFDDGRGDIVKQYVTEREQTDTLAACRAVAKQCFDKFGGSGYENFYYPYSGLFKSGEAIDWFALYDKTSSGTVYKSECARQLSQISSCKSPEMMEKTFGGLDLCNNDKYGTCDPENGNLATDKDRELRPTGVATEIYYQIIDTLNVQCGNLQGRFVETQFIKTGAYTNEINRCLADFAKVDGTAANGIDYGNLVDLYGIGTNEDMCPRGYNLTVDTKSWGICSCWENGARRSRWGKSVKCVAEMPITATLAVSGEPYNGAACPTNRTSNPPSLTTIPETNWCGHSVISITNQVCPYISSGTLRTDGTDGDDNGKAGECRLVTTGDPEFKKTERDRIPEGIW